MAWVCALNAITKNLTQKTTTTTTEETMARRTGNEALHERVDPGEKNKRRKEPRECPICGELHSVAKCPYYGGNESWDST